MLKSAKLTAAIVIVLGLAALAGTPRVSMQTERTLAGEWIVDSSPINGQMFSPKGLSLGFPQRDMLFAQQQDLRTGVVLREDVGSDVKPLGVWRVSGDQFSSTFQLWCPNADGPCGSIVMRGHFVSSEKISGVMTAFFDIEDTSTPTGYDTWTFSFVGNRVPGASSGGSN